MASANPIKWVMNWLNAEEDDEMTTEDSPTTTSPAATAAPQRRQRGPLMLHGGNPGSTMEIRHPRSMDERLAVGMDLKQRRMVTLDLNRLPDADARYFLEFIYGVSFALDATVEKVNDGIYILIPQGIIVHNDTEDALEDEPATPTGAARVPARSTTPAEQNQTELFWQGR